MFMFPVEVTDLPMLSLGLDFSFGMMTNVNLQTSSTGTDHFLLYHQCLWSRNPQTLIKICSFPGLFAGVPI